MLGGASRQFKIVNRISNSLLDTTSLVIRFSGASNRSGLPEPTTRRIAMGTKSRERLYGTSVRIAAERAAEARREADKLACDAWTKRMLAFKRAALAYPRRRAQCGLSVS